MGKGSRTNTAGGFGDDCLQHQQRIQEPQHLCYSTNGCSWFCGINKVLISTVKQALGATDLKNAEKNGFF